jgi:hypothetical protein
VQQVGGGGGLLLRQRAAAASTLHVSDDEAVDGGDVALVTRRKRDAGRIAGLEEGLDGEALAGAEGPAGRAPQRDVGNSAAAALVFGIDVEDGAVGSEYAVEVARGAFLQAGDQELDVSGVLPLGQDLVLQDFSACRQVACQKNMIIFNLN